MNRTKLSYTAMNITLMHYTSMNNTVLHYPVIINTELHNTAMNNRVSHYTELDKTVLHYTWFFEISIDFWINQPFLAPINERRSLITFVLATVSSNGRSCLPTDSSVGGNYN